LIKKFHLTIALFLIVFITGCSQKEYIIQDNTSKGIVPFSVKFISPKTATIDLGNNIVLEFSNTVDTARTNSSISISPTASYNVIWDDSLKVATLKLLDSLAPQKIYKITVSNRAIDIEHVKLERDSCFTFITRPFEYSSFEVTPDFWDSLCSYDENGIPMVFRASINDYYYNPVTLSQYALSCFDAFIRENDSVYYDNFMSQVEWLSNNYDIINDSIIGYPYPFLLYNPRVGDTLIPPWYSGMAQGHAASVLIRAYILTKNIEYMKLAQKSINFMFVPISENGLMRHTPEGNIWIEEYPTREPSLVLNGYVFSLYGLLEYIAYNPEDIDLVNKTEQCLNSLISSISYYERENWLQYCRYTPDLVTDWYMRFQTLQMNQLYVYTGDIYFYNIYEKWKIWYGGDL